MAGKAKKVDLGEIVNEAASIGIDKLYIKGGGSKRGPLLDEVGMYKRAEELLKKGYSPQTIKYDLANKIYSKGAYLRNNAKEVLINRRLEYQPYGKWSAVRHPIATLKHKINPSYLDNVLSAASEIYDFAKVGGHLENLSPKLAESVTELKNLDFYDAMVHILRDKGLIWGSVAREAKHAIRKKAQKGIQEMVYETKKLSLTPIIIFSFAASVLLTFGIANITGFAIANKTIKSAYPISAGFVLLIIVLFLLLRNQKRKTSQQIAKNSKSKGK